VVGVTIGGAGSEFIGDVKETGEETERSSESSLTYSSSMIVDMSLPESIETARGRRGWRLFSREGSSDRGLRKGESSDEGAAFVSEGNLGKRVPSSSASSLHNMEIPVSFISLLQISAIDNRRAASSRSVSEDWDDATGPWET